MLEKRPSPKLSELAKTLNIDLPKKFLKVLDQNKIGTLEDIRRQGGLSHIKELDEVAKEDSGTLQKLQAHADLSLLPSDVKINNALIEQGYTSVSAIASAPLNDFLTTARDLKLDESEAAQLHITARAQESFLNNMLTGIRANLANGIRDPQQSALEKQISALYVPSTDCKDCESAVSPVAYLAELLKYATDHLMIKLVNEDVIKYVPIDFDFLDKNFHQPFGELSASCESMEKQMPQARLGIEVLRSYLKAKSLPPKGSKQEETLKSEETNYCLEAYKTLLNKIGTSYEEIRLSRTASVETRQALADRLGIALEHLSKLLLDPNENDTTKPTAITEQNLERIFGLVDTTRDPLTNGIKSGDATGQITHWNLKGVEWNKNTDAKGTVYVCIKRGEIVVGNKKFPIYAAEIYRDSGRQQRVAKGSILKAKGSVDVKEENASGLSGTIEIDYTTDSENITIKFVQEIADLLSWRLQHLRTLWKNQDWPNDPPPDEQPLIDPDIIEKDDLQNPVAGQPAFDLWQDRRTWVNDILAQLEADYKTNGLDAIIEATLKVPATHLDELAQSQKDGNDITSDIGRLKLNLAAFTFLQRMRELATQQQPILAEEWSDVCSILAQVQKRWKFGEWREKEKVQGITLGPDYFKIPTLDYSVFPPPPPPELPKWRATFTARRDWQDALLARIDQEKAVIAAFQEAVSAAEEVTLPTLRDALIDATDATDDKAEWLVDRLLIDTKTSGAIKTTRIAQAVETLQGILFSVRTDQFQNPNLNLTLSADNFDEEWKWIGSYATWRAATFVFLYPENILQPSLRRWQTPAFRTLVEEVRGNRRLNPEQARAAAATYSEYFRDICSLKLEASCQASTRLPDGTDRSLFYMFARGGATNKVYWSSYDREELLGFSQTFWKAVPDLDNVVNIIGAVPYQFEKEHHIYLFARTQEKGMQKLEFCKYDLEKQMWTGELFEPELPKDDNEDTVAFTAVIKQQAQASTPPHLAIRLHSGRIYCRKLNREGSDWDDSDWKPLIGKLLEHNIYELCAMVEITQDEYYLFVTRQAGVLLWCLSYRLFGKHDDGQWRDMICNTISSPEFLGAFSWRDTGHVYVCWHNFSLFGTNDGYSVIKRPELSGEKSYEDIKSFNNWLMEVAGVDLRARTGPDGKNSLYRLFRAGTESEKIAAIDWLADQINNTDDYTDEEFGDWKLADELAGQFLLTALPDDDSKSTLAKILKNALHHATKFKLRVENTNQETSAFDSILIPNLKLIAKSAGSVASEIKQLFAYQRMPGDGIREMYLCILSRQGDMLTVDSSSRKRLAPRLTAPFDITEKLSAEDLKNRRIQIKKLFDENSGGPPSNLAYLEEACYFVPIHLALQLQTRGQYTAALDWFRTVYDYNAPMAERKIYYGLEREKDLPEDYTQELDWLLDPLNPHAIAAKRRNTYTRFTLLSIIRCFLDFADAEFTRDTAESVPRARTMYLTASELLGAPELEDQSAATQKAAMQKPPAPMTFAQVLTERKKTLNLARAALLTHGEITQMAIMAGEIAGKQFFNRIKALDARKNPAAIQRAIDSSLGAYTLMAASNDFCFPPNPILKALRLRSELNLYKLRNGRNIAGMERQLEPYAAPTDTVSGMPVIGAGGQLVLPGTTVFQPTPYRFAVLIERAKQLVGHAQQLEATMLAALEKRDAEYYNLLKARQDVRLARAGVRLQDLRICEAENSVTLAELQQERSQIQADYYQMLLDEDTTELEDEALKYLNWSLYAPSSISFSSGSTGASWSIGYSPSAILQTLATISSTKASYERRRQEWQFQLSLAAQDIRIGTQQVRIAEDHVRVVGQERVIAEIQTEHAEAIVDFLANKFTNVELYDWMSNILERVYSFFLQQATSVAQLAANQLAFERQEVPPPFIQADYWEAPNEEGSTDGRAPDRRGLTGSARLLQDIYQLDQYAFETNKRKLQLTKTISLASLAPEEFQRFRENGVMTFALPMTLFDRDFPGHYLRLIRRVRTSVIALIPPIQGIHATLTSNRLSRVVIGGDIFQTVPVQHGPDHVALSSPRDATGMFELEQQSEMLAPFEGIGVDTTWEFRMPKASNLFDYRTIADVLLAIEYTALNSFDYRQQVIQQLDTKISADRPFSFQHQFSDAWYELHNADPLAPSIVVQFETTREDFPPNIENLKIEHVVLYFARKEGLVLEQAVIDLQFIENGKDPDQPIGGGATWIDGVISTRRGNAGNWMQMIGKTPFGQWKLALPNTQAMGDHFKNEEIEDILFVITYGGHTPAWPA